MKRLLLVLILLGGLGTGGYYFVHGRLPWVAQSPEELQVAALRAELDLVRQQWKQAGRAATFGMDTGTITDTPLAKLEQLEGALADLEPRLTDARARNQASQLHRDIAAFKGSMR